MGSGCLVLRLRWWFLVDGGLRCGIVGDFMLIVLLCYVILPLSCHLCLLVCLIFIVAVY